MEKLNDDELRELAVRDSQRNPPKMQKAQIIAYLLETDEERHKRLIAGWGELETSVLANMPPSKEAGGWGRTSIAAWWSRINLILNRPAYLLDLGILLIPVLGLLTVILPQWRGWRLEKRFRLREHAGEFPEIDEMQAFVGGDDGIELRVNLLRPGLAFVYPRSYRRPRLAVLGGMYVLWRSDQHTAQSIILHEIEHVRHGDYLIVGYGSFFAKYLKWLIIGVLLLMGLIVLVGGVFSLASLGLHLGYLGKAFATQGLATFSATVSIFFLMMKHNRAARGHLGGGIERGLCRQPGARPAIGIWHSGDQNPPNHWNAHAPPIRLRMWLVERNDWVREVVRQMLFPCSFLLAVLMLFWMRFFAKLPADGVEC